MERITIVGSSNTDMVVKTSRFPRPGETLMGGEFHLFAGGKGANQAVAAARLGGKVRLVARVGDDVFGRQARAGFQREGIDCSHVTTDREQPSGTALITVNAAGENTIVVAPGANDSLVPALVADLDFLPRELILTQLETPLETVTALAAKPGRLVLNPAPARDLPDELLARLFLITPNETEAGILSGVEVTDRSSAARAAGILLQRGVRHVVITLGAAGAHYASAEDTFTVAAPQVNALDTTAAGDVFNGALIVALAREETWADALRFAVAAASVSVTRMGAQDSAPRPGEVPTTSGPPLR